MRSKWCGTPALDLVVSDAGARGGGEVARAPCARRGGELAPAVAPRVDPRSPCPMPPRIRALPPLQRRFPPSPCPTAFIPFPLLLTALGPSPLPSGVSRRRARASLPRPLDEISSCHGEIGHPRAVRDEARSGRCGS
eukprot:183155-Prymnesium_polylepis.2